MVRVELLGATQCPTCGLQTGVSRHPEHAARPIRQNRTGICRPCYQRAQFAAFCETRGIAPVTRKGRDRLTLAVQLRAFGMTWAGIADALGYSSPGGAARLVTRAIRQGERRQIGRPSLLWTCPDCGRATKGKRRPGAPGVQAHDSAHRCWPCMFKTMSPEAQQATREEQRRYKAAYRARHSKTEPVSRPKITHARSILIDEVMHFRAFGWSQELIASRLGVTEQTVRLICKEFNL